MERERDEGPLTAPADDDEDFDYTPAEPEAPPQVSSYIAIIRIVSVLAMGLCVSFGIFLMLIGWDGVIIGLPLLLLAIPCYFGMQLAEKLAAREERQASVE